VQVSRGGAELRDALAKYAFAAEITS